MTHSSRSRIRLPRPIGVYAILDMGTVEPSRIVEVAIGIASAGVQVFQVRAKGWSSRALLELCVEVRRALPPFALVLVNDRADVALAADLDGVHVGDEDLPPREARRVVGEDRIVGFSTHAVDEIAAVDPDVCDYAGFGPVFETTTKRTDRVPQGLSTLAVACQVSSVPVVAIGGIRLEDLPAIRKAGAQGAAMISGLLAHDDPIEAARLAVRRWKAESEPNQDA